MKRFISFNPKLKARARELRKNSTEAENKIWQNFLRNFPLQVNRQKPIDNFIVDFYVPKMKLVIEIDGDTHFNDNAIEYDRQRTAILEGHGLMILRFTNKDVYENLEYVCEAIMNLYHSYTPSSSVK